MNTTSGRDIISRTPLFLLTLPMLILLVSLSTITIDFANVSNAQDYNGDNFTLSGDSSNDNSADGKTISTSDDNRDKNTKNQGIGGDNSDSSGNDNSPGDNSSDGQNSGSNQVISNGQKDVGLQGSTTNEKLPLRIRWINNK